MEDILSSVDPSVLIALLTLLGLIVRLWQAQLRMKQKAADDALRLQQKTLDDAKEVRERLELSLERTRREATEELNRAMDALRKTLLEYEMKLALQQKRIESHERERLALVGQVETLTKLMETRDSRISVLESEEARLKTRVSELERKLAVYEPNGDANG
jgi:chromosome segregation ATPase